jgi:hypothetical protein
MTKALPMSLFPDARANLSEGDRGTLHQWETAASKIQPAGPNVVANVKSESHLVGNPPDEGSSALQALLLGIVTRLATDGAKRAFEHAATDFVLEGRLLAAKPKTLYRFLPIDRFGESVARANDETPIWDRDRDSYITDLLENWQTLGREKLSRTMLAGARRVFVTFETPNGKVVSEVLGSAREIMDALGVGIQAEKDVIGLRYPPPADAPLKYPTVADGGWSEYFGVCKPTDAHGWTRPISSPGAKGWPEAVHHNRRADLVADRPSRHPYV